MTVWLRALDDYLILLMQEAYLWLWDRTGVFVGTLMFGACALEHVCWGRVGVLNFIALAFMGVWTGARHVAQAKDLRWLNSSQRAWAEFTIRRPAMVLFAAFLVGDAVQLNAWRVASDVFFFVWNYACVQVRDREPKDFLSFRNPVGAGA